MDAGGCERPGAYCKAVPAVLALAVQPFVLERGMSLDDELEELSLNPTDSYASQRAAFIRSEIEQRDTDYDHFLKTHGEVVCQSDGLQAIRYAFQRGWETGDQHGRNTMAEKLKQEQRYYR